jgi:hypothetical protein
VVGTLAASTAYLLLSRGFNMDEESLAVAASARALGPASALR